MAVTTRRSQIYPVLVVCLFVLIAAISSFPLQTPQTSPTLNASPSPAPSTTPTVVRAPTQTPTPLPGAKNFHQWGSITIFNGLPSDTVRAITQTPDGVMWFGTDNGLARFDGRLIQNFSLGSFDANLVLALKTTPEGHLWIGTRAGAFVSTQPGFQTVPGTEGIGITAIMLGEENYLGTDAGTVLRVIMNEGEITGAEQMFPDPVLSADGSPTTITGLIEHEGKLLASTSTRGVLVVSESGTAAYSANPNTTVVNALVGTADKLWFGTNAAKGASGIFSITDGSRAEKIAAPTADAMVLDVNDSGLWAGSERYGLFHFASEKLEKNYTFENTSGGLRSDNIFSLFTDREGVLWVGTNRGVSRFDRLGPFQQTVSDIPNSNFIRTLFQTSDGRLYAGSNRGLFYQGPKDEWIEVPALKNKAIYAIDQRADGSTIIGTPEGMFDISGSKLAGGDVRSFGALNGRMYAAVYGRGVVDVTGNDQWLIFNNVTATSVLGQPKRLWIGTAGQGLFSFDGQTVREEASPEILKSGTICNMFQGSTGTLYIAGQHGVFAFRDGQVEQIFAAEDVRDIFERNGHIWAATTTRGLLHSRHDERFGWLVSSIGFEQGLPSEKAFSIHTNGDDELVIATNRGVVTYQPRSIAPKIIATRVLSQRTHDPIELGSTIALEYPQNSIFIEVAGQSSRTFAEEFQYAYLLRNANGDIVDSRFSNEPQYIPANLKPGEYSVESVAYDRDLLTSEPLLIRFSIGKAPFPWTATALGVLLAIALIALIWAMIERKRIVERNRELAAARFDLANEAERERGRIARDLHDQTLADLRELMIKSDKLENGQKGFRDEIEDISVDIRRICEDLSPSVLENVGLVAALEFLLTRSFTDHKFTANEHADENLTYPMSVQLQIYRIAQEVLTNIKHHSDADHVEVTVEAVDGRFGLTIADNGTPFQPNGKVGTGRGISNIRSRANIIKAKVVWENGETKGNVFTLKMRK